MAYQMRDEQGDTAVYLDRWFWDEETQRGWPSIPFLADFNYVNLYRPEFGLPPAEDNQPVTIYAWKFYTQEFVPEALQHTQWVQIRDGSLARGDLEESAYPLYIRFHGETNAANNNEDCQLW